MTSRLSRLLESFRRSLLARPKRSLNRGRKGRSVLLPLQCESLESRDLLAVVTWSPPAQAVDFSWKTPANWVGGAVPQAGDTVRFDNANAQHNQPCFLNSSVTVESIQITSDHTASLSLGGGVLTLSEGGLIEGGSLLAGEVVVRQSAQMPPAPPDLPNRLIWSGGTIASQLIIQPRAVMEIKPGVDNQPEKILSGGSEGGSITNSGRIVWSVGTAADNIAVQNSADIRNLSRSTFAISGDVIPGSASIGDESASGAFYIASGATFLTTVDTTFGVPFISSGLVEATLDLSLNGFKLYNGVKVEGTLTLGLGNTSVDAEIHGVAFSGGGDILLAQSGTGDLVLNASGYNSFENKLIQSADITISGNGTMTFRPDAEYVLHGGTVRLSDITIVADAKMTIDGSCTLDGVRLANYGVVEWSAGTISTTGSGGIDNKNGAVFDVQGDLRLENSGEAILFTNEGDLNKSAGNGNARMDMHLFSTGRIAVAQVGQEIQFERSTIRQPGGVRLNGGGFIADPILVAGGNIIGPGSIQGSYTQSSGTLGNAGGAAGTISFSNDFIAGDGTSITLAVGHDELDITGSISLIAPTLVLNVNNVPAGNGEYVLINNKSSGPVAGQFLNMPEGYIVPLNGAPYALSYVGGDGNDVVLRAITFGGVSPSSGSIKGNQLVSITGTGLSVFNVGGVEFGGVASSYYRVISSTLIEALTPAGSAGNVSVHVDLGGNYLGSIGTGSYTYYDTSTAIVGAPTGVESGTAFDLQAAVACSGGERQPSGEVEFFDGNIYLGRGTLDESGIASLNGVVLFGQGNRTLWARYLGSSEFPASSGSTDLSLTPSIFARSDAGYVPLNSMGIAQTLVFDAVYNDTGNGIGIVGVTQGEYGSVQVVNGDIYYQMLPDLLQGSNPATTKDSFSYTIRDANGNSATANVYVNQQIPTLQLSSDTISELQSSGSMVGTVTAVGGDAGETFALSLLSGTGFSLDSAGSLSTTEEFDYEAGGNEREIEIQATGSNGTIVREKFVVHVTNVNEDFSAGPIAAVSVNEGDLIQFVATADSADPLPEVMSYSLSGAPTGASIDAATGLFTWIPTESDDGTFTFDVVLTDGSFTHDQSVTITVDEINLAPNVSYVNDLVIDEDQSASFTFSASDSDIVNGHASVVTYSVADLPQGASFNASSGEFDWTPTESQDGWYAITFTATDDGNPAKSSSQTVFIYVSEVNQAPVLAFIGNQSVTEGAELTFTAAASDADLPANSLEYSLADGAAGLIPAGASIDPSTGSFVWTPSEDQGPGTFTFDVVVSDGSATDSETITVTVGELNVAPVLTPIGNQAVMLGSQLSFAATAMDVDLPENTLTFGLANGASGLIPAGTTIDANTGVFDWTPTSSGIYTFDVVVSDGSVSDSETIIVTVNAIPVITSASSATFTVGTSGSFTVTASGFPVATYSASTGSGQTGLPSGVTLSATGVLSGTATAGGTYTFTITATNSVGSATQNLTLTVNQAPAITSGSSTTFNGGSSGSFTVTASGFPAATFSASTGSGQTGLPSGVTLSSAGDLNGAATAGGVYTFTITASNSAGSSTQNFTLTVNSTPTDITLSASSVAENQASGTTLGVFSTVDPDAGNSFTYTLVSGTGSTNNASFTIDGSGNLKTAASFDFETKNSYSVRVRSTDQGGLSTEKVFAIAVSNVNEAPTDIALSASSVAENEASGTIVGSFSTTDVDAGNSFTYTLVSGTGGTDNGSFMIDGSGNLKTAASFDYETKNSYSIRVRSTDQGGLTTEKVFTIGVTDVNEAPSDIALSALSVAENQVSGTVVGAFSTSDPDAGSSFTYTLVSGAGSTDNTSFTIDGSGNLKTAASFDYETKNSYSIRVRSTDQGGLTIEKIFTIAVTNVNETPTDIALAASSVAENQASGTSIGAFATSDPDSGNTFSYTLVSGTGSTDNASFTINGGTLKTAASFDYETKNSYTVRVRSTDQDGLYVEKTFTIAVTDVNEAPTDVTVSGSSVAENQASGTTVGSFSTTDPDAGNSFTYILVSGTGSTDNGSFTIDGSGSLKTAASFDFETKNSYSIRVRSTDQGGLTAEKVFTIAVTNVNEAPTDIALSASSVAENQSSGTTVGSFSTTDVDAGDSFTYTLVSGTGSTDNTSFTIDGSGNLKTAASFDYETKNSYSIRVRSTDQGGLTTEKAFTIGVTNVTETPSFTNASSTTFSSGSSGSFTVAATDSPTFAASTGGGQTGLPSGVTLSSAGALSGTATTGGVYTFTITATNSAGSSTQNFTLTVNQAPAITSASSTTFTAGSSGSFSVTATGYPAASFAASTGNGQTGLPSGVTLSSAGVLSGTATSGGTYTFTITATNSVSSATQNFTLTVNQAPSITSGSSTTFTVGSSGSFTVTASGFPAPTFSASVVGGQTGLPGGVSLSSAGVLSGTPTASGAYTFTITANNTVGSTTQNFTLTVNQTPSITSASSATFTAGSSGSFTVTASGFPTATFAASTGSGQTGLPSGVTLSSGGVLSGTPSTGGTYTFTITASNSAGSATQNFTLTVNQTPSITSGSSTSFTAGSSGSFTVTASGFPAATFAASTGSGQTGLPSGVTLSSAGSLSGTASTAGTYTFTITATNSSGSATQNFTLTVNAGASVSLSLSSSQNPSTFAGLVTYTATVSGGTATGNVTFYDNGTSLAIVSMSSNTVTYAIAALSVGSHTITASYSGNLGSATAPSCTQVINSMTASLRDTTTLTSVSSNFRLTGAGATMTDLNNSGSTIYGGFIVQIPASNLATAAIYVQSVNGSIPIRLAVVNEPATPGSGGSTVSKILIPSALIPSIPNLTSYQFTLTWTGSAPASAAGFTLYTGAGF